MGQDYYNVRIDYLHFLGMIRKMFEKRNVWERVDVSPAKPYDSRINVKLIVREGDTSVDIFQPHEKSWLEDYHVGIESIHPHHDHFELRLTIH